jgi:cytoskeletal protein RodZ
MGVASAGSDAVKVTDLGTIIHSYGRAGGPVGSDRVMSLASHTSANASLGVSWDAEVAARTNMPTDRAPGAGVGVAYDQDVAERTNMPRANPRSSPLAFPGRRPTDT